MEEQKINKVLLLLMINSIYFFSYFQRVAVPGTVFNELQSTFSLSATSVTALGALTFLIYGIMQIFAGIVSDRFGGFKTFFAGGLLLSLSSMLFSFSYSPAMLFVTRAFLGFSASFVFISLVKILSSVYEPKDFPLYLGISLILGYSGGIFATYPLERSVSVMGWRNSFLIAGILCSVFAVAGWPVLRSSGNVIKQKNTFSLVSLLKVARNTHSFPVLFSGPVNFGIYFLFQSTLGKKFLQDSCGLTSAGASLFTFIMIMTNTGFAFLSGYASRLAGKRRPFLMIAAGFSLVASLTLFLNLLFAGAPGIFLFSYLLLAISAAVSPVYITTMKEMNSVEVTATSVGLLNSFSYLFMALFSYAAGRVLDTFRHSAIEISGIIIYPDSAYRMIFLGCIMLTLCSFLVSFLIRETGNGQK